MTQGKRQIVVGDVHGCLTELNLLLDRLEFCADDHLIFVGDLINKGPDSFGVLQTARACKASVVVGNHELGFLSRYDDEQSLSPCLLDLKRQMEEDPFDWRTWMQSWPAFIDIGPALVVHAGLAPGMDYQTTDADILANIRNWHPDGRKTNNDKHPPWFSFPNDIDKPVVYGHWAKAGLHVTRHVIGLDTGCVYGRSLSALILPDWEIVQIPALQSYTA